MERKNTFDQLCWDCKKAIGGCPWSSKGIPVDGWTATPTKIENENEIIRSYRITACPEFEPEETRRKRIYPGDRIKLEVLSELLKVGTRSLKSWSDKHLIDATAKSGLKIDVQHKKVRIIRFLGLLNKKAEE